MHVNNDDDEDDDDSNTNNIIIIIEIGHVSPSVGKKGDTSGNKP